MKFLQLAVVASSLSALGAAATQEHWGEQTTALDIELQPGAETVLAPRNWQHVVIPDLQLSPNYGLDVAFGGISAVHFQVDRTGLVLAAQAERRKRKRRPRYGAFEGY